MHKYPHQDDGDEVLATPSAVSPSTGVSTDDQDTAGNNYTTPFPPRDFDQATGSGMLPSLSGEEELSQETPVRDPEEAQPTAESEPQNKTPDLQGSETNPESKKTQAEASADGIIR